MTYQDYLQTPGWLAKRAEKAKQAGHCCERCDRNAHESQYPLEVHHKTYASLDWNNPGSERLEDLELLCRDCHQAHHHQPRTCPYCDSLVNQPHGLWRIKESASIIKRVLRMLIK